MDMDRYVEYPGQFEPADLADAQELLDYCMRHNIVIDVMQLPRLELVADLLLIKSRELSKFD